MQFEFNSAVGSDINTLKFIGTKYPKLPFFDFIVPIFQRLGAKFPNGTLGTINFPPFVTFDVIREIVRNTCYECGGLMQDSTAFVNQLVSFDDFGNDAGERGTTQSFTGKPVKVAVRKCNWCGHSHM
jgi:hypothetical protein